MAQRGLCRPHLGPQTPQRPPAASRPAAYLRRHPVSRFSSLPQSMPGHRCWGGENKMTAPRTAERNCHQGRTCPLRTDAIPAAGAQQSHRCSVQPTSHWSGQAGGHEPTALSPQARAPRVARLWGQCKPLQQKVGRWGWPPQPSASCAPAPAHCQPCCLRDLGTCITLFPGGSRD